MEAHQFGATDDRNGRRLLVMLPGAHMRPEDFATEGFVSALGERGCPLDATALRLDLADYSEPDFPDQLHEIVVAPALTLGYVGISLLGISLGGMGALLYARRRPEVARRIVLLAPFLATRGTIAEVVAAGGLTSWQSARRGPDNLERGLLGWISSPDFVASIAPRLLLGFGSEDRFAEASLLLARLIPREQLVTEPGWHDWPCWRRLWNRILGDRSHEL